MIADGNESLQQETELEIESELCVSESDVKDDAIPATQDLRLESLSQPHLSTRKQQVSLGQNIQDFLDNNVLDKLFKRTATYHFDKANKLFHQEHYEGALVQLNKANEKQPNSGLIWFNIGRCYEAMNQLDEAQNAYETSLELDSDDHECLYNLARLLYSQKNYDQALAHLNHATSINETHADADTLTLMGFIYEETQQFDQAITMYLKAQELDAYNIDCRLYAAKLYIHKRRNIAAAKDCLPDPDLLPQFPLEYTDQLYDLALCYALIEKWPGSIYCCKRILEQDSNHSKAYNQLGLSYYCNKEYDLAVDAYISALNIDAGYATAINNLACTYEKMDRLEQAIQTFEQYISTLPEEHAERQEVQEHINLLQQKLLNRL